VFTATSALQELAHGLRSRADALRAAGDAPSAAMAASGWTGNRAQALAGRLHDRQQVSEHLADECDRLAAVAETMSGDYAASVRRMQAYEDNVRHWLLSATHEQRQQFGMSDRLPPTGSPQWTQVAAQARRSGAPI
jgi:hypothetical protein